MGVEHNLWAWGRNGSGQLGLGDNEHRNIPIQIPNLKAKQIAAGANHTLIIDNENNIWFFAGRHVVEIVMDN